MDNEFFFQETQRFKQWWIWLILLGINGLILFGVFKQVVIGEPLGNKPVSNFGLFIIAGLSLSLILLFLIFRLDTQIRKDGIYVKFVPFHSKFRKYEWSEISKSYIRQYHPIREYGGWGLRGFENNRALNISGNIGLQLEFANNAKLLIGTNKPIEMEKALAKIGQSTQ